MRTKVIQAALVALLNSFTCVAQEAARILESTTSIRLQDRESIEIRIHEKIRVLSEEGYPMSVFVDYEDDFRKIESVTMTIYDKEGRKVKKHRKGEATIVGYNPSYEINDAKTVFIDPGHRDYPFVIEKEMTIRLNGFIAVQPWVPRSRFNLAVDRATFTVTYRADKVVNFKVVGLEMEKSYAEGWETRTFSVENMPAVPPNSEYVAFYDAQPKVLVAPQIFSLDGHVGSNQSWVEFGNWFLRLNADSQVLSNETKSFIDHVKKTQDREQWPRSFYHYMQDRTRYVSIQLGIGGFKSLPVKEVEQFGFGDCKALSTYMKTMLDYSGIKSNYVLVKAGKDTPDIEADFPSNQFNHVYVAIPQKADTVFLECTSQDIPFGFVGSFTDDRGSLWVEKDASSVIRGRKYSFDENKVTTKTTVVIKDSGDAVLTRESVNHGVFLDEEMLFKNANQSYIKEYNEKKFDFSDFKISEFSHGRDNRDALSFKTKYVLDIKGLGKDAADHKMIVPMLPTQSLVSFLDKNDYTKHCHIRRAMTIEDDLIFTLPRDSWTENLPEPFSIQSAYGNYSVSYEQQGKELLVHRKFTLFKGKYEGNQYESFTKFVNAISKVERRRIVLNSKT